MTRYICIDGGTTNTRINLLENRKLVYSAKYNVGARMCINDREKYVSTIKNGIETLLKENNLKECDVDKILAAGMITSEYGLVQLPHTTTLVGLAELNKAVFETGIKDISGIPFVFVRGVKTKCDTLENADMMRGEEAELMGIFRGEGVYILPGSHSKLIEVDTSEKIVDIKTLLTGEMCASLLENTILKDTFELGNLTLNEEWLIKGYNYAKEQGINEALFKVRVLKNLFGASAEELGSFYMGAILCDEINAILKKKAIKIIIGGSEFFKAPTVMLLKKLSNAKIIELSDEEVKISSSLGMIRVFEGKY